MIKERIKRILPLEINFEIKNILEYLKKNTIKYENNNKNKIIFIDAASYNNLGDQAIALAMNYFIKDNFPEYEYMEVLEKDFVRNINRLKKSVDENDIICLSGGGNMGNLYPRFEAIRRKTIKSFKNNKIIIFPQTIDYENNKYGNREFKKSIKIYNSNQNLIVCAREMNTYNKIKDVYKRVILVPDIVLYLYKKIIIENDKKYDVGICLREDKEANITNNFRKQIYNKFSNIIELTTMSDNNYINNSNREKLIKEKLEQFSKAKLIVTDRLHGMIFSILNGTPCLAIDNSNKKVSGVYNTIRDKINFVNIIDNINDLNNYNNNSENIKCYFNNEELFADLINVMRRK